MNTKALLTYGLRIPLKVLFWLVSFLVHLSKGSKYLISLKITLGTLLIMFTVPMYSQKKDTTERIKNSASDTLYLNVTLQEDIKILDEHVFSCYFGVPIKRAFSTTDLYDKKIQLYIAKNLTYPKKAKRHKIEGKIKVEYLIDKYGKATEPKIIKGIGYGCDEEAFRLVKSLPKYDQATDGNKTLPYKLTITIEFKLPQE